MKIKITKCSDELYWYRDKIGEEFEVLGESESMGYYVKKNITIKMYVDKQDCLVIKK